jgi:uncharacterized protein (DUF736 family)
MTAIGYVTKNDNGSYKGQLRIVSICAATPSASRRTAARPPRPRGFRLMIQRVEIDAGLIVR